MILIPLRISILMDILDSYTDLFDYLWSYANTLSNTTGLFARSRPATPYSILQGTVWALVYCANPSMYCYVYLWNLVSIATFFTPNENRNLKNKPTHNTPSFRVFYFSWGSMTCSVCLKSGDAHTGFPERSTVRKCSNSFMHSKLSSAEISWERRSRVKGKLPHVEVCKEN